MPISKEVFDRGFIKARSKPKPKLETDYVLEFLKSKEPIAYKVPEIVKVIKKSPEAIRNKIRDLVKRGLLTRKLIVGKGNRKIPYYRASRTKGKKTRKK